MRLISENVEEALDVIEFTFRYIVEDLLDSNQRHRSFSLTPSEAVEELNTRFREHSVGFQFVDSQIILMSSDFLHAEVIKPVLLLLNDSDFEGAHEEFHNAHRHYRDGLYKECLTECLKSFESTIKSIATLRGWSFDPKSAAKSLVQICVENELLPPYIIDTQITHFRLLLESVAIPRNKNAAHGQGPVVVEAPEYIARYGLNLTGTSILLLIDAHKEKH